MGLQIVENKDFTGGDIVIAGRKHLIGCTEPHRHKFFEIEYILNGDGEYIVNGREYPFKSGVLFFMTPADFHTVDSYGSEIINIMFAAECAEAERLLELINSGSPCFELENISDRLFVTVILDEIITACSQSHVNYSLELLSCLLDKLALLRGNETPHISSDICSAVIYMLNHFKDGITLADASAVAGYTPEYFSLLFKKEIGISFKKYLNNIQFDYSAKLLRFSDRNIIEICFDSGFNDYANFERRFKEKFGLTPKEYRQNFKNN